MFCGEDEFYDGVVGLCSKCSDICAVVNDFCADNCPGYRHHVTNSSTGSRHVVTSSTAAAAAVAKRSDTLKLLMSKPLFWTSVSSLCVSVVATTVLVVLCFCHRRRRPATAPRRRVRQLVYSTAESSCDRQPPSATCHNDSDKTLISGKSTVNIMYRDSRLCNCRGDVALAVSRQESACISLYSVDDTSHLSLDRDNTSRVTEHPHSSRISWIDWMHQSIDVRDADDVSVGESQCEEDTQLKANWASDELRRVTDYSTSRCTDSSTSPLMKLSAMLSREENNNRTLNSEIHAFTPVMRNRQWEILDTADSGCDEADDDSQLKLQNDKNVTHATDSNTYITIHSPRQFSSLHH